MRYIHFQTAVKKAEITLIPSNDQNKSTIYFQERRGLSHRKHQ